MFLGLFLGYQGGSILAQSGPEETAIINIGSLMLAGMLSALLLTPRAEKAFLVQTERFRAWYDRLAPTTVAAATFGLIVALLLGVLLTNVLRALPFYSWWLSLGLTAVLAAFFVAYALRNQASFAALSFAQVRRKPGSKILDSNVIIDGRIVALSKAGFVDGELIVPAFILRELQTLSDHADSQKRVRGKRGLSVLEELREQRPLRVEDWDDPNLPTTDDKLIRLARETGAKLLTNDTNLAKIAKLHGLDILSIHEAAVALRPQLQAGDSVTVTINKGGQQQGQGVGYLEDGTMVVVEEAFKLRGKPVRAVVVNNVQTNVGRMVFAKLDKEQPE